MSKSLSLAVILFLTAGVLTATTLRVPKETNKVLDLGRYETDQICVFTVRPDKEKADEITGSVTAHDDMSWTGESKNWTLQITFTWNPDIDDKKVKKEDAPGRHKPKFGGKYRKKGTGDDDDDDEYPDWELETQIDIVQLYIKKCPKDFHPKGPYVKPGEGRVDGNSVEITAYVKPDSLKGRFTFILQKVSDEPGYCLNAPLRTPGDSRTPHSDSWKDLRLRRKENPKYRFTSDAQQAQTKAKNLNTATVIVACTDYGAYGQIRAKFVSEDGKIKLTTSIEEGGDDENGPFFTRIPYDDNKNLVPDSAANYDKGPDGKTGRKDDVEQDVRGGKIGDGFSRYQEWRGIMVKGAHTRLKPTERDLCVVVNDGGFKGTGAQYVPAGIANFSATSKIKVHLINNGEWTGKGSSTRGKRLVNPNKWDADKNQYGVYITAWIMDVTSKPGFVRPDGGSALTSPQTALFAAINRDLANQYPENTRKAFERAIGHELGHACGVDHHNGMEAPPDCIMREPFDRGLAGPATRKFCNDRNHRCQRELNVKDGG